MLRSQFQSETFRRSEKAIFSVIDFMAECLKTDTPKKYQEALKHNLINKSIFKCDPD